MYNISFINNSNSIFDLFVGINETSGGLVAGLLLLNLFLLIFIVFKQADTKAVLLVDSFITTIVAALMWASGLIGFHIAIFPIILLIASIIFNLFWNE